MIDDYGPPSATVQIDGDEKRHPCDWQIEGMARGFANWRIVAYGQLEVGAELRVTLRCQLGALTGTALVDRVEIDAWNIPARKIAWIGLLLYLAVPLTALVGVVALVAAMGASCGR